MLTSPVDEINYYSLLHTFTKVFAATFEVKDTYSTYSKPVFQFLDETKQTNVSPF